MTAYVLLKMIELLKLLLTISKTWSDTNLSRIINDRLLSQSKSMYLIQYYMRLFSSTSSFDKYWQLAWVSAFERTLGFHLWLFIFLSWHNVMFNTKGFSETWFMTIFPTLFRLWDCFVTNPDVDKDRSIFRISYGNCWKKYILGVKTDRRRSYRSLYCC